MQNNLPAMQGDHAIAPGPSLKLSLTEWRELKLELDEFNSQLNEPPHNDFILTRELSGGKIHQYVPISYVQDKLQEYFGMYQVRNFRHQVVVNEIVGTLDLWVLHPILGTWVVSTGTAAVMIMQRSKAKPSDVDAKYSNALESAIPHLKSDCIANAAKELGKVFGRDLNRKHAHRFNPALITSTQRMRDLEQEKKTLEASIKVLDKYKEVVSQYTSAEKLHQRGSAIYDEARREGLLEQDEQALRQFIHTHYLTLKANGNG